MNVSETLKNGKACWKVDWRAGGRRERRFFDTKTAALTFANSTKKELKDYGSAWAALPPMVRAELATCWTNARDRGYSVVEACRLWEATSQSTRVLTTVKQLVDQCILAKQSQELRPESLRIFSVTLKQFKKDRESVPAGAITSAEISEFVSQRNWGAWRRRGAIIDLHNLFEWGCSTGLLARNPVKGVKRPSIDHKTPKVLSPERCQDLLALCRAEFPKLLPWLCISLFAGVRPAEVERLNWSDIKGGLIHLSSDQAKGRARRLVTVRPNLAAWLEIGKPKTKSVCVSNHRAMAHKLRIRFREWPRDVLRHSFISYEVARSKDVQATAIESGNTPDVIFRHYREVVTPEDAARFWSIVPV